MRPIHHRSAILQRIASGDEKAFSEFYHHHQPALHRAAMVYLKDDHAAREIVQVTFIKIWERRATLHEISSVEDYLFILIRNAVFDHFKKVTVETKLLAQLYKQAPDEGDTVTQKVLARENSRLLQGVLDRLPRRQRQVYLLANEYEMSYDEIATQLKVSRFTVKRHLEIARRFVRKNFLRFIGPFL
jgi:RNA polymerase sigma-70 factor (ECF subfamily)